MSTDTYLQILALVQAHKQTLISNTRMMVVEEVYLQDYDNYITDLERESGEDLRRFRIPPSAIKSYPTGTQTFDDFGNLTSNNPRARFCEKPYFLGQLDALLGYLKTPREWPSHIG